MHDVSSERRGAALVISYANPPRDTMTAAGAAAMKSAFDDALADPGVRAIVFTGKNPLVFVRHYDVGEIVGAGEAARARPAASAGAGAFAALIDAVAEAPKPVIAAINGVCMGGGFELTLACDIRIAGRRVEQIGLPEVRVGIFPGAGGTQRLPRMIGEARALAFILQGAVVGAEEAERLGLVHECADDPLAGALDWAERFARLPPGGIAAAKRLVRGALDRSLNEGLAEERRAFAALLRDDEDATRAMKASLAPPPAGAS
jgi:enoyl-CoA hydratase/carnithine racemase